MTVTITEEVNDLELKKCKMNCDKDLGEIPEPFSSRSFFMAISGSPGSGKSSLMVSVLNQNKPRIYKGVFHNVFIIAPKASLESITSNIFRNHNPEKIYNTLNTETLDDIKQKTKEESEEGFTSLIIIDDQTAHLKDKNIQLQLQEIITNRRHARTSIMLLVQSYNSIPLVLRKSIMQAIIFKPLNKRELSSMFDEILFQPKDIAEAVSSYVFKDKHDFLFINVSTGNLYKKFNKLIIND